jgi:2-haloacid dehalogenase
MIAPGLTRPETARREDAMTPNTFMFDAYGTLFDVHSAVREAGASLGALAEPVSQLWRAKQLE